MGEARTFYPNTIPAPIRKLWIAYDLLVKLGKPCKSPECQTCQQGRAVGQGGNS